jgi:hypothetical protein
MSSFATIQLYLQCNRTHYWQPIVSLSVVEEDAQLGIETALECDGLS